MSGVAEVFILPTQKADWCLKYSRVALYAGIGARVPPIQAEHDKDSSDHTMERTA